MKLTDRLDFHLKTHKKPSFLPHHSFSKEKYRVHCSGKTRAEVEVMTDFHQI